MGSSLLSANKVPLDATTCDILSYTVTIWDRVPAFGVFGLLGLRAHAVSGLRPWVKVITEYLLFRDSTDPSKDIDNIWRLQVPFWTYYCTILRFPVQPDWLNTASLLMFNAAVLATTVYGAWSKGMELKISYPIVQPLSLAQLLLQQGDSMHAVLKLSQTTNRRSLNIRQVFCILGQSSTCHQSIKLKFIIPTFSTIGLWNLADTLPFK
ncbi:hypothetical protein M422DRAFT_46183 [Sphaerobolus stellatus SS14]|nr:hypothetical protein M422DRAFT_46183 [Sphaerobolus stellatus SS14]